ncbi:MAG: hypothetical protein H6575_10945 [Lewinellaceae bacterium]|nr:hypothetical protein [Lewinellaceae bacterium]
MLVFYANTAPTPLQLDIVRADRFDRRERRQVTISKYTAFNGIGIQESFTSFFLQRSERGLFSLSNFLHFRKIEWFSSPVYRHGADVQRRVFKVLTECTLCSNCAQQLKTQAKFQCGTAIIWQLDIFYGGVGHLLGSMGSGVPIWQFPNKNNPFRACPGTD